MAETRKFPQPPRELWGIWIPDGGPDDSGGWMQHTNGPQSGPMAFETEREAQINAEYEMRMEADFEGLTVHRIGVAPGPGAEG